jgi:cold shock protein
VVAWFDVKRGMGFISREDGSDVFVHHTKISSDGRRELHVGDSVEFTIGEANNRAQAFGVRVVGRAQDWRRVG